MKIRGGGPPLDLPLILVGMGECLLALTKNIDFISTCTEREGRVSAYLYAVGKLSRGVSMKLHFNNKDYFNHIFFFLSLIIYYIQGRHGIS